MIFIALAAAIIEIWGAVPAPPACPRTGDYVERWWHLLGISFTSTSCRCASGQAIFRQPRLLTRGLFTSTL